MSSHGVRRAGPLNLSLNLPPRTLRFSVVYERRSGRLAVTYALSGSVLPATSNHGVSYISAWDGNFTARSASTQRTHGGC